MSDAQVSAQNMCAAMVMKASVSALIEMNGMVAENKQREVEGKSPAFTESDFLRLQSRLDAEVYDHRNYFS
jgi:hypothetical protein